MEVEAVVNELEEFRAYTTFPAYKADRKNDTSYMGRFTFPMLLGFYGFQRILTILARGFLFEDGGNGYDRIDYARRALLAWCSVSTGRTQTQKKSPDQTDSGNQTNYAIYHAEFPDLVDKVGDGWLIRHVENIVRFVEAHPNKVRKEAIENAASLKKGFHKFWADKVDHLQAVPFSENTNGKWGLRIEDVLADALVLGPLQNRDFELQEPLTHRLTELTPKSVPPEVSNLLYKYYIVSRNRSFAEDYAGSGTAISTASNEEAPFVILPEQNVNACFGNTTFSQKWVYALTDTIIERETADGVCKYRINDSLLCNHFPKVTQ